MISRAAIRAAQGVRLALRAQTIPQSGSLSAYRHFNSVQSPVHWPAISACTVHFSGNRQSLLEFAPLSTIKASHFDAGIQTQFPYSISHQKNGEEQDVFATCRHTRSDPCLSSLSASSQFSKSFERSSPKPYKSIYRRHLYTGRLCSGVEKRRTVKYQSRYLAASSAKNEVASAANGKLDKDSVTWRDALKSPRKAIQYAGKLRRDLVDWAKHMWAGVKLLAADVRVSTKILKRITHGKQISRRERNFIVQTGVDLARLVPFSLFLIIPLAEFALPFALRLFPNMLPSQFQDQMKSEEKLKRRLKARLELAKYLSEVVEEKAKRVKSSDANAELKRNAEDLTEFLDAIRIGKDVSNAEVSRFAKFFNDELTIDGAARPQLVAMCKYMGISPYGHDMFLRFKLRSRLNAIKKDDMEIVWEGGVDSLTDGEVAKACRDRGIREEVSSQWMRKQLRDWIELAKKREIPSSLLIMSRALLYTRSDEQAEEGLRETLGSMPDDVIMDVKQAADVRDGSTQERLAETLRQARLIEIESERAARKEKDDEEKRKKREEEEREKEKDAEQESVESSSSEVSQDKKPDETIVDKEVMEKVEKIEAELSRVIMGVGTPALKEDDKGKDKDEMEEIDEEEASKERDRMRNMLVSLGQLSSDSSVQAEREDLRQLKLQLAEAEGVVKGTEGENTTEMRRLKALVSKLEREIERVDTKVGLRMKLLDQDNDGVMSLEECKQAMSVIAGDPDDDVIEKTLQRLDADADGNISRADLARLLHEMQFEYGVVEEPPKSHGTNIDKDNSSTSSKTEKMSASPN